MRGLAIQLGAILQCLEVAFPIQCYDCIRDHPVNPKPCPGQLVDYPTSTACRVSALGDGTVIEQTVTPSNLCDAADIRSFLLGIARRYRVGDGQVSCCYTSGCNKDIVTARGSYESQSIPFRQEAFKKQSLIKAEVASLKNEAVSMNLFWIIWFFYLTLTLLA